MRTPSLFSPFRSRNRRDASLGLNARNIFSYNAGADAPAGSPADGRKGRRDIPKPRYVKGTTAMRKFGNALVRFLKGEDGPTAVEYAVMLALIIVVCIGAVTTLGLNASNTFNYIAGIVAPTGS